MLMIFVTRLHYHCTILVLGGEEVQLREVLLLAVLTVFVSSLHTPHDHCTRNYVEHCRVKI